MRLTELHPEWITLDSDIAKKVGVFFDCPVHRTAGCIYPRIPVYFANPPSGCAPLPKHDADDARWQLTGDTFREHDSDAKHFVSKTEVWASALAWIHYERRSNLR
jgi:hypothetical protein